MIEIQKINNSYQFQLKTEDGQTLLQSIDFREQGRN